MNFHANVCHVYLHVIGVCDLISFITVSRNIAHFTPIHHRITSWRVCFCFFLQHPQSRIAALRLKASLARNHRANDNDSGGALSGSGNTINHAADTSATASDNIDKVCALFPFLMPFLGETAFFLTLNLIGSDEKLIICACRVLPAPPHF